MVLSSSLVALAVFFSRPVKAQVVQDDWLRPALPDFSSSLVLGTNFTIQWTQNLYSWFAKYAPAADVDNVDLWLKSTLSPHTLPVKSGINVRQTQSISWVVDVPPDFLSVSTRYSFQFRAASPDDSNGEVSSPQFVVRDTDSTISSTSITTSSTSSTAPASSSSTALSTTTPAPALGKHGSSLSPGAIAGTVIGIAALIAIAVGIFLFRKKRASRVPHGTPKQAHETPTDDLNQYKKEHYGSYNYGAGTPAELSSHGAAELPSH